MRGPTVTVVIPTYREERNLPATLATVQRQTYSSVVEVFVVDGRSDDRTRSVAAEWGATVLDNPGRIQACALNIGLAAATGDVIVRVDGHCLLEEDYVASCVRALQRTGAAMVGGAMRPVASGWAEQGIAVAMASKAGAGPARFHTGGPAGWVDTVYLGAFWAKDARAVGGYDETLPINEDAEFAIRMRGRGGVWFDPSIRSLYRPRSDLVALARQFFRYGAGRAHTVRKHPWAVRPRQLAAPALVLGLVSPVRRPVGAVYLSLVAAATALDGSRAGRSWPVFAAALPVLHLSWGLGFLRGLFEFRRRAQPRRRL